MARYYIRISHTFDPDGFHSLVVSESEVDIESVSEYCKMIRGGLEDYHGAINILLVDPGNTSNDEEVLDQYGALDLIYVARHIPADHHICDGGEPGFFCA